MNKSASISHDQALICEPRDDPELAAEYQNAASVKF